MNWKKANKDFYSSDIQNATIDKANKITENLGYREIFPHQKVITHLKILLVTLAFFIVFYFSLTDLCKNSIATFTNIKQFAPKYDSKIGVKPGNATVLRGTNLKIIIKDYNPNLKYKIFSKKNLRTKSSSLTGKSYTFFNITDTVSYWVKNKYATSDTFFINSLSKPAIRELTLKYDYPKYSKIPNKIEENTSGNIITLRGTKITSNLLVNNDLSTYRIVFSNGTTEKLEKLDKYNYTTQFIIDNSGTYHFLLTDTLNNKNQTIERTIYAEDDLSPTIEIISPAEDKLLAQKLTETLEFTSSDDFGLFKISVVYKKTIKNILKK